MRFLARVLADDEEVVVQQHPHWKTLLLPALLVPVVAGVAAFSIAAMPAGSVQQPGRWAVAGVAVILLIAFSLLPWLRWRTTHFVLTDQRIILRTGVLSRTGRDIPLSRVNDVSFHHNLFERMLGCGTLVIESGGERGQLVLHDVPEVEWVQRELAGLVEGYSSGAHPPPPDQRSPHGVDDGTRTAD